MLTRIAQFYRLYDMVEIMKKSSRKHSAMKIFISSITNILCWKKVKKIIILLEIFIAVILSIYLFNRIKYEAKFIPSEGVNTKIISPTQISGKTRLDLGYFPIKGNADAKVTIIEFADFRCPYCAMSFNQIEPRLYKDYIDTGKARFAFRQFVKLGPASATAANAAECANDQDKFWEMHDYLYQHQPPEADISMYNTENLTQIAGQIGMNTDKFRNCLSKNLDSWRVNSDRRSGENAGVYGTPTFFINGKMIVGAKPYSEFQLVIDQALK